MSLSSTTSRRFRCGRDEGLDPVEALLQAVGRRRLDQVGEGAVGQAVLPLFLERDDLHGDVPRGRIELEVVEHGPAEHVGQEDVEGDGGRAVLAGQEQAPAARAGDDPLEALVAGQAQQDAGVMRIVLDDQQRQVALLRSTSRSSGMVSSRVTGRTGRRPAGPPARRGGRPRRWPWPGRCSSAAGRA